MKRSIFHAIFVRWTPLQTRLKNDLSVRDDRRGVLRLLFSPKHLFKRNFSLSSWNGKEMFSVKTIVKYIYPTTPDTLSTQRQARQTQIQRHTPFNVPFDVDKFNA